MATFPPIAGCHVWVSHIGNFCQEKYYHLRDVGVELAQYDYPERVHQPLSDHRTRYFGIWERREIGTLIHKEREQEAASRLLPIWPDISLYAQSEEEGFACEYLLKLYQAFKTFLRKRDVSEVMEFPVIGFPIGCCMPVVGRVDEVRYDRWTRTLIVSDIKTRGEMSEPKSQWEFPTIVKLSLYRRMLEDFFRYNISWKAVGRAMNLDLGKDFSLAFQFGLRQWNLSAENFFELYDEVLESLMREIPKNFELNIEYVHQETRRTFRDKPIHYDEVSLKEIMDEYFSNLTQ